MLGRNLDLRACVFSVPSFFMFGSNRYVNRSLVAVAIDSFFLILICFPSTRVRIGSIVVRGGCFVLFSVEVSHLKPFSNRFLSLVYPRYYFKDYCHWRWSRSLQERGSAKRMKHFSRYKIIWSLLCQAHHWHLVPRPALVLHPQLASTATIQHCPCLNFPGRQYHEPPLLRHSIHHSLAEQFAEISTPKASLQPTW